jgi:RNA recognition motif-containing protein
MDSDQGKLFIGGISWETTEDKLSEHFSAYGEVTQAAVMRDKLTGRPRGFGFVVFTDTAVVDRALQDPHTLDGRTVRCPLRSPPRETLAEYSQIRVEYTLRSLSDLLPHCGSSTRTSLICCGRCSVAVDVSGRCEAGALEGGAAGLQSG